MSTVSITEPEVIEFITEFKENYDFYNKRNKKRGEMYGTTPCVQYTTYEGDFLIKIKDVTDYYKNINGSKVDWDEFDKSQINISILTEEVILSKLFNRDIDSVFNYTDLRFDLVGQTITFSLINDNKKIYCKASIFDNLNVNRWDFDNKSCNVYLQLTCSLQLDDLLNDEL